MEAVAGGGAALLILAGYAILKRFRRSNCHSTTGFCECDSPAIELAREVTVRIDQQEEQLKQLIHMLQGQAPPTSLHEEEGSTSEGATNLIGKADDNLSSYSGNSPPVQTENPLRGSIL
jgi:hypothetical protein